MEQGRLEQEERDAKQLEKYESNQLEQERDVDTRKEENEKFPNIEDVAKESERVQELSDLESPVDNKKKGFKRKTLSFINSVGRKSSTILNRKASKTRSFTQPESSEIPLSEMTSKLPSISTSSSPSNDEPNTPIRPVEENIEVVTASKTRSFTQPESSELPLSEITSKLPLISTSSSPSNDEPNTPIRPVENIEVLTDTIPTLKKIPPGDLEFSVETINQIKHRESQLPIPITIWQQLQKPQHDVRSNAEQSISWSNQNQNWSDTHSLALQTPPVSPIQVHAQHSQTHFSQTSFQEKCKENLQNSDELKVSTDCEKKFKKIKFEIQSQNLLIEKLKMVLQEKELIKPRTCKDDSDIKSIKSCIDHEIQSLHKMIKIGFKEQEKCKYSIDWGQIPLTIALDESTQAQVLLVGMKDRQLIVPEKPSNISYVSGCSGKLHFHDIQQQLNHENKSLEEQRFKLQEQVILKDTQMDCLQKKVHVMSCQLAKVCQENKKLATKMKEIDNNCVKRPHTSPCTNHSSSFYDNEVLKLGNLKVEHNLSINYRFDNHCLITNLQESASNIETNFNHMTRLVDHLNCELENVKRERCILNGLAAPEFENQSLQERNKSLADECRQKECDIQNLQNKLARLENSNSELDKKDDYKVILMEMAMQLDHYKEKYIKSQQKVEENELKLTKMELKNQTFEDQVNEEIKRVKCKFQEKFNELSSFPKRLTDTTDDLMQANKKINKLEEDLKEAYSIITKLKNDLKKYGQTEKGEDFSKKYKQALLELDQIKKYACELKCSKISAEKQYRSLADEFKVLKSESAKIIANTKECGDTNRKILYSHIDKLEKDLVFIIEI